MHDLSKTISEYIEQQFPAVYREDGPNLVAFTKAYYEFMENTSESPTTLSRSIFQNRDIDETLDSFLVHFKEKYLSEFPYAKAVDKRFAIKHIMDYYRSKGTPQATELLIRLLFNEEATVYYPGDDILRASDSRYKIPKYLEVTQSARSAGFVENQITGSQTGATAFVEGLVKKRVQGRIIDILYISNIKGTFNTDELVSDDGLLTNAPKIIGSLSSMNVTNGGKNNAIGNIFDVVDDTGKQGKIRVTGTEDATGLRVAGYGGYLIGSDTNEFGVSGPFMLYAPHNASAYTYSNASGITYNTEGGAGYIYSMTATVGNRAAGSARIAAEDVDAIKFLFSSGNIESGEITMFGIVNS